VANTAATSVKAGVSKTPVKAATKQSVINQLVLEKRTNLIPYEAIIMVHPDASEDDQKNLFKRNKGIVESFKGSVNHLEVWGKRSLANPIENHKKAYYFHTTFEAEPSVIAELERTMRINDKVLRFMHTRLPDKTNLVKFMENFKQSLADSATREREREAKFQARKAANRGDRGDRGGGREGGGRRDFGGKNEIFEGEDEL
jgi:small subunit ribosomal protein S6